MILGMKRDRVRTTTKRCDYAKENRKKKLFRRENLKNVGKYFTKSKQFKTERRENSIWKLLMLIETHFFSILSTSKQFHYERKKKGKRE